MNRAERRRAEKEQKVQIRPAHLNPDMPAIRMVHSAWDSNLTTFLRSKVEAGVELRSLCVAVVKPGIETGYQNSLLAAAMYAHRREMATIFVLRPAAVRALVAADETLAGVQRTCPADRVLVMATIDDVHAYMTCDVSGRAWSTT